jgi:nitroimidazol reductase NimA-like FMN-containing flavoprotein (pyridoxamine 5'-phosphate oxidase superfamily)
MDIDSYHNKESAVEGEEGRVPTTARTEVRRHPERGAYETERIRAILDEGLVCHVGIATDDGPVVIPTTYGRVGDVLYLHGSPASRLLRTLKSGVAVCVTVTLIDGLVLAHSTLHHSLNYRSVVIFGTATEVVDLDERARALALFVEHVVPGRTADARAANERELRATLVLALPIVEASVKARTGPPLNDPADLDRPVWSGVVPFGLAVGAPERDGDTLPEVPVPGYVAGYARPRREAPPAGFEPALPL